jgi:hypothetical protein
VKKYLINEKNFELKDKFNLDELDELNEIGKCLFPASENVIQGNFSKGTLKRFLKIVLKSDEEIPDDFFGKVDEVQFAEVFGDFFLNRIGLKKNT